VGYRIRVLGTRPEQPSLSYLKDKLLESTSRASLKLETGTEASWNQLVLAHPNGPEIALVECNPVVEDELGKEEIEEFIEEIDHYKPISAGQWLKEYLPHVKVIYAIQLLSGTDVDDGWKAVHAIQGAIWNKVGGILQADGEGFTNEDGYQILWQFSDKAAGKWKMAVLDQGKWVAFDMELDNLSQREDFAEGKVPRGAHLI
jgi:hypothetical protein